MIDGWVMNMSGLFSTTLFKIEKLSGADTYLLKKITYDSHAQTFIYEEQEREERYLSTIMEMRPVDDRTVRLMMYGVFVAKNLSWKQK
jgi:hypothetical protein